MRYQVTVGDRVAAIDVRRDGDAHVVRIDGGPERRIAASAVGPAEWMLQEGGSTRTIGLAVRGEGFDAQVDGHGIRGTAVDARKAALSANSAATQGEIRTMMPGAVIRIPVAVGAAVHKGQVLVVVEAMKMENEFKAPRDGVIGAIHVTAGTTIEANALLITLAVP
jgi:biotin carboxyl carrier protein